jgi:Oxidoreductase family, NAD-binding Rossmann fold
MEKDAPVRLGVIGAGDIFKTIKPALDAIGTERARIDWIADIKRKEDLPANLFNRSDNFIYHQIKGDHLQSLPSDVDAVLDLTPHEFHASNLQFILSNGKAAFVEKPFAVNREGIANTAEVLSKYPNQLAYFAVYYRDEKGLVVRTLLPDDNSQKIRQGDWHSQFLTPVLAPVLPKVLDSIGDLRYIVGTCLEGPIYGSIVGREWLGDKENGGMALDLGDHVFSFVNLLKDRIGTMTIENAVAGVSKEAFEHYTKFTGKTSMAEMYAEVSMRGGSGFPMRFAMGKYTGVDEWVFHIQGEQGYVHVNLDSKSLTTTIDSSVFKGDIKVNSKPKYTLIMSDFLRRAKDPLLQHQYGFENCKETLEMVLDIKDRFNQAPRFEFETGQLPGMDDIRRMYRQ